MEDVCWLLAYDEYHRNGEPDDAYAVFNDLYSAGRLMPTEDGYDSILLARSDDWFERFFEAGIRLLARARAHPGSEAFETWEGGSRQVICVDMVIEGDDSAEEGWMGVTLPDSDMLTDEQVYELVAGLIPEDATPLYSTRFKDRERRRGEIVYRWEFYQSVSKSTAAGQRRHAPCAPSGQIRRVCSVHAQRRVGSTPRRTDRRRRCGA